VRRVLHLAARTARIHNPILRAFGDHLESRGKPYKVVIVAITRKLLIVARRLCTDPNFVLAT
jgi:transposase